MLPKVDVSFWGCYSNCFYCKNTKSCNTAPIQPQKKQKNVNQNKQLMCSIKRLNWFFALCYWRFMCVFLRQVWICWLSWWSYSPTPVCFTLSRKRRRQRGRQYLIGKSLLQSDFSSLCSLMPCAGSPSSSWRYYHC